MKEKLRAAEASAKYWKALATALEKKDSKGKEEKAVRKRAERVNYYIREKLRGGGFAPEKLDPEKV